MPTEITEAFTDMPHAVYEWVAACHGWEVAYFYYLGESVRGEGEK